MDLENIRQKKEFLSFSLPATTGEEIKNAEEIFSIKHTDKTFLDSVDGISSSMEVEVRDLSKELEELLKTTLSPKTKEVSSQYFTASQILEFCRLHHDFIGNSKYANIFPMKNNYFAIVYENQVDGKPFVYIREGGKGRFWDAEHIPRIFLLN